MSAAVDHAAPPVTEDAGTKRDFLLLATGALAATGAALAVWPLLDSMNPAADVLAVGANELDLKPIELGQRITVQWRGRPVFISRRTTDEIAKAKADDTADMPDPETDAARVESKEWLIVVGICTHLGCIPLGQKPGNRRGKWDGWFCPCHGSHYDTSGRIRKGPAPRNLVVPAYRLLDKGMVRIG